jgi:hypothetical protein
VRWVATAALGFAGLGACGGETDASATNGTGGAGTGGNGEDGGTAANGGSDAALGGDAADGGAWRPPPGTPICRTNPPDDNAKGEGQCAPPGVAAPTRCYNACWDEPGAPGPEQCAARAPSELGSSCCYPGGCAFDFGEGCTYQALKLPDETVLAASPCGPASTVAERIFEGAFDRVVLTDSSLAIGTLNAFTGSVTTISATCVPEPRYSNASVWDFAVADEVTYVVGTDPVSGYSLIQAVSNAGQTTELPLTQLFGAHAVGSIGLAVSGTSLYALLGVSSAASSTEFDVALLEIPAAGAAPRVVATALTALEELGSDVYPILDGPSLVLAGETHPIENGPISHVGIFDFETGSARLFFDRFQGTIRPFDVEDGRLYLVRASTIVSIGLADCSIETLVERPEGAQITALAVDGAEVFWAEQYDLLAGARIFSKRASAAPARLVQVRGSVNWMGLDSKTVYWAMSAPESDHRVLARRLRPAATR